MAQGRGAPTNRWSAGFGPGSRWRWSGSLGDEERQQLGWRGQRGSSSAMAAGVRSRKKHVTLLGPNGEAFCQVLRARCGARGTQRGSLAHTVARGGGGGGGGRGGDGSGSGGEVEQIGSERAGCPMGRAEEWGSAATRGNQLTCRPSREKQTIKNSKTKFKTNSNLSLSKTSLTGIEKFQIKYGC
jgi:hypothetical protein